MVRIKHRYLLLNVLFPEEKSSTHLPDVSNFVKALGPTPQHVTSQVFMAHLRSQIAINFGDQGLGLCLPSLKMIYFSNATSTAIIRIPRASYQVVWATLTYMTELPAPKGRNLVAPKCVVRVVRVSGTIRKAEEELLRRSRSLIVQAKLAGTRPEDNVLSRLTKMEHERPSSAIAVHHDDLTDTDENIVDDLISE